MSDAEVGPLLLSPTKVAGGGVHVEGDLGDLDGTRFIGLGRKKMERR